MTTPEFIQAAQRYHRQALTTVFVPMGLALACVVAYAPFTHRFEDYLLARFDSGVAGVLVCLPMAGPLVLALLTMLSLGRRIEKSLGMPCPHCGKELAGQRSIVIASKSCPACGEKVIETRS